MTSGAARTPGPWRVNPEFGPKNDSGLAIEGPNGEEVVGAYNYHCCNFRDDIRVSDADARLIAAAPDLLGAARDLVLLLHSGVDGGSDRLDASLGVLIAAIEKATDERGQASDAVYWCFGCGAQMTRKGDPMVAWRALGNPVRVEYVEFLCPNECSTNMDAGRWPWDPGPKKRKVAAS